MAKRFKYYSANGIRFFFTELGFKKFVEVVYRGKRFNGIGRLIQRANIVGAVLFGLEYLQW